MNRSSSWVRTRPHLEAFTTVVAGRRRSARCQDGPTELAARLFFLVVGWRQEELDGPAALEHYRQRGTFEDRLGEFQQAIGPRLSHDDFAANEALLRLSVGLQLGVGDAD